MRRVLAVLLVLVLGIGLVPPVQARTFDGIAPFQANGRTFCTTFAIAKDTWATAAHCALYAMELRQQGAAISINGVYAEVISVDGIWDLAVVHSQYSGYTLPLGSTAPAVGDAIEVQGFPYGMGPAATYGHIAALNIPIEGYHMSNILDLTVAGGNSGSPVLMKGKVIGVLWGGFINSPHSLAVPFEATVRYLRDYLK